MGDVAPDRLEDFALREIPPETPRRVYTTQLAGPGVIVMTEFPGITPQVARFARWMRDAGFTVYLPDLFGVAGSPGGSLRNSLRTGWQICISREFHLFRSNSSGPLAQWLRELATFAHGEAEGKGVGAIGMCVTGNFALSMMVEPVMLAPVLSQPSLPLLRGSGLHIGKQELACVKRRMEEEGLTVLGYRFKGDCISPEARFRSYERALGGLFVGEEIADEFANKASKGRPHSVLTTELIDEVGEPTREAVDAIIDFLRLRLY